MYNNPQIELTTIREAAGFAPLTNRAFLRVTGSDAARWLNGMVTNAIQTLQPGEGNYNFLLNAQGRIQGDCTIYREGENTFLLQTDATQLDNIQHFLDKFIIMDDVELTPVENRVGLLVIGQDALSLLGSADITTEDLEPNELAHVTWNSSHLDLIRPYSPSIPKYEIWTAPNNFTVMRNFFVDLGVKELSSATLETQRILSGIPKFGQDIRDRDLPQETAQTHALHFAKGCYLGQEIVERIRSRGQVHRQFTAFRLTGDLPSTLPAPLKAAGKPAGELTSAVLVPLPEGPTLLALGYARREALDLHQPLTYPGGTATPHPKTSN
jgi:folate-binding protein YgfZ